MIDPAIGRLMDAVAARGEEISHWQMPGFEPVRGDARTPARSAMTFRSLDVAPPPDARFVFSDRAGRRIYSRDGGLHAADGKLVNAEGAPVLGYAPGSTMLGELHVDPAELALGRVHDLRIERDGSFAYSRTVVDARTAQRREERVCAGTVALARFPAGTQPVAAGFGERAPIGVEPHVGRPGDANFAYLETGRRDTGSLDLDRALALLHDAYQQLDAVTAARQAVLSGEKTVMDLVK